jgi:hypothetical protein
MPRMAGRWKPPSGSRALHVAPAEGCEARHRGRALGGPPLRRLRRRGQAHASCNRVLVRRWQGRGRLAGGTLVPGLARRPASGGAALVSLNLNRRGPRAGASASPGPVWLWHGARPGDDPQLPASACAPRPYGRKGGSCPRARGRPGPRRCSPRALAGNTREAATEQAPASLRDFGRGASPLVYAAPISRSSPTILGDLTDDRR